MRHQHQRPLNKRFVTKPMAEAKVTAKGTFDRRIIQRGEFLGANTKRTREYVLHATKGFRSYRKLGQ